MAICFGHLRHRSHQDKHIGHRDLLLLTDLFSGSIKLMSKRGSKSDTDGATDRTDDASYYFSPQCQNAYFKLIVKLAPIRIPSEVQRIFRQVERSSLRCQMQGIEAVGLLVPRPSLYTALAAEKGADGARLLLVKI